MKKDKESKKDAPAEAVGVPPAAEAGPVRLKVGKEERSFDINDPKLPDWVDKKALKSGNYPYDDKLPEKEYEETLEQIQIELVKCQAWMQATGRRVLALFEGRDAAGKGGTIFAIRQYMNPRTARNVALPKPTETERGQWYFQRYVAQFPTAGEFVTFDRSWYNRAGVEPVMGFCTPEQHRQFLDEAPHFEEMIVNEGIYLFKFWLDISQEMQLKRFHDRRHSPLKNWKFSPMDVAGMTKWDDYTKAIELMVEKTHTARAPWIVVQANDKRRARIAVIRHVLRALNYPGRDLDAIGRPDGKVIHEGMKFLND
ncbi:polyphosphate kinase 2 [Mesorhizobium sp. CC13]|uniref:polyphosphate kinase 2 n=1 Tax=Mesorhizobium sp. CC13 TaxID=3029194 RepID=UPI003265B66E